MKFNNAQEIKDHLWKALDLAKWSIAFTCFELEDDDHIYVGGGIVAEPDDMYSLNRFCEVCLDCSDHEEFNDMCATSYLIGDGEVEHANDEDAALLEAIAYNSPEAFDNFIREYAEHLAAIKYFSIENPDYDPDEMSDEDMVNELDEISWEEAFAE